MEKKIEDLDSNFLWINCFKCFDFFGFKEKAFFLLSCMDISCVKCLQKVDAFKVICPCCEKQSTFVLIADEMPASVKRFFHPTSFDDKSNIDWEVIRFQQKCHERLITRLLPLVSFGRVSCYILCMCVLNSQKRLSPQNEYQYYKEAKGTKALYDEYQKLHKFRLELEQLAKETRGLLEKAAVNKSRDDFTMDLDINK